MSSDDLFRLFDDLEAQAESVFAGEREAELADRARAEYQQVTLAARLMASVGHPIVLEVEGVGALAGELARVATGWVLLSGGAHAWLVRTGAVGAVRGASPRAVPEVAWPVTARLGVGSALRRLADAGEECLLQLLDGSQHLGTLARVGADFVEVRSAPGQPPALIAIERVAAVRARSGDVDQHA